MKIKMLSTQKGSPNGIEIVEYEVNKEYDVPDSLYKAFVIGLKVAIPVNNVIEDIKEIELKIQEKKMEETQIETQEKKINEIIENKSMSVPSNKKVEEKKEVEKEIDKEKTVKTVNKTKKGK